MFRNFTQFLGYQLTLFIQSDWKDVAVAAAFAVIYALRLAYQAYLLRHRDKTAQPGDWNELLLVVVPKNILVVFTIYLLILGVPRNWIFFAGWTLFLFGIGLRAVALYQLGTMYSLNVEVRAEHKLVTDGAYALVRHPLYLAYILDTIGIVLFLQRWYLALVVLCVVIGWGIRIRTEEAALRRAFGSVYDSYAEKIPSLNIAATIYRRTREHAQHVRKSLVNRLPPNEYPVSESSNTSEMKCTPLSRPFFGQIKLVSRSSIEVLCPHPLQASVSAMVDRRWRPVAQGLMEPCFVVKPKISCQMLARVPHALVVSHIDVLVLHTAPQPLDKHVIQRPPTAIHADPYASFLQPLRKGPTGKLRALVRVEDLRLALPECLLQGLDTKRHVHRNRHRPGQDIAREPIDDRHQVHETRLEPDIGNVRTPHLIGSEDPHPPQEIGIDHMALCGLAQPRLGIDGF